MSAGSVGGAASTYGKLQNNFAKITLPASSANPAEIEIGGDDCQICLQSETAFDFVLSTSAASAKTILDAGTAHASFPAGVLILGIAGYSGNASTDLKLYVRDQTTSAGTMTTWRHRH